MKKIYITFICLILILFTTSCSVSKVDLQMNDEKIFLSPIDTEAITKEIEKSSMPDMGYRFANNEFQNQISAYATYYIREAKKFAGLISENDTLPNATQEKLLEKFVYHTSFDLTDIFCTLSLIDNEKKESNELKKKISKFLDSLYNNDLNCYVLPHTDPNSNDIYRINIYPTFHAEKIARMLSLETPPIDSWIEQASKELFTPETIQRSDSSAYVMLISLMKTHNIEISQETINLMKQMFEDNLNDISALSNYDDIYLPVFLMDYLEFSALTGIDTSKYCASVIAALCDSNGIKNGVIEEYDVYGLYASMYAFKLAKYDFRTDTNVSNIFHVYDNFLLSDFSYFTPGQVSSNFLDTYFVDALIRLLDIETECDIKKYCQEKKEFILESGVINIYYYLDLLQRNGWLDIIKDEKNDIIETLSDTLASFLSANEFSIKQFSTLNATLKSLNILNKEWKLTKDQLDKLLNSFVENDNQQQLVYDLGEFIDFLNLACPENHDMIQKYCKKLEKGLIDISTQEVSNKVMLESKAFTVFEKSGYTVTTELFQIVKETVNKSQDDSGLYRGGDSIQDIVSFRNTYDAILLYKTIKKRI